LAASFTITNFHGCEKPTEGAEIAASKIFFNTSSSIGSSIKRFPLTSRRDEKID
jgi:hypothetical protein